MNIALIETNYSPDMKTFEKFKDDLYIEEVIEFIIEYIYFYVLKSEKSIKHIKGIIIEYLIAMIPEKCTNRYKIKHYIYKNICSKIENLGLDLEKILNGDFSQNEHSIV
jgi:hypothetical protein